MKPWRVVLTESAQADIRGIHDYIAFELLSPENASALTNRILDAVERLATFPKRHPLCLMDGLQGMDLRMVPVERYRVFYKIMEDSDMVLIVRILYERRDVANAFSQ